MTTEDPKKEEVDYKSKYEDLESKLKDLETRMTTKSKEKEEDPDITEKAKKSRESEDKGQKREKDLERALTFTLKADEFLKNNRSVLPKDVEDIFKVAKVESYDSPIDRVDDIKSGIVQSFFKIQANLDLLTSSQKEMVEDYLKLTKTGKKEMASELFNNVLEPTLEMIKRIKKTEELNKGGFNSEGDMEKAYKEKLMKLSNKHYLGKEA